MIRRIVGGIVLSGLMASAAAAQLPGTTPFSEGFKFVSGDAGPNSYSGEFNTSTNYGLTGEPLPVGTTFQVWCVDPDQFVHDGELLTAEVTPLASSASSFTNTYAWTNLDDHLTTSTVGHPDAQTEYTEAAWLIGSYSTGNTDEIQCAIWLVMGYSSSNCDSAFGSGYYENSTTNTAITTLVTNAQKPADYNTVVLADWGIITPTENGCYYDCEGQEFLYEVVPAAPPSQVTPEPGTLTLVAMGMMGMAGTLRRRKRRTS